jgi:hypothetical protein
MSPAEAINKTVPIDPDFFCDGHFAVLLSQSLGGSGMDPHKLSDTLGYSTAETMNDLLSRGICLPIFFDGDCALDGATLFVLGNLDEAHARAWVGRITGKLRIPCGKLVLLAGGGDGDELARAVSGQAPEPHYCIYQTIDVPPDDYRVDIYAYAESLSIGLLHGDLEPEEISEKYAHLPAVTESYVIQLTPLREVVPLPTLVEEIDWPGVFELRPDTHAR